MGTITRRRDLLKKKSLSDKITNLELITAPDVMISILIWLCFVILCVPIVSFELSLQGKYGEVTASAVAVTLLAIGVAIYIQRYQKRLIANHARAGTLAGLFLLLLAVIKAGHYLFDHPGWVTGTAVGATIILAISYEQRFALGMSLFYLVFACFTAGAAINTTLAITIAAGVFVCCMSLKEIRTRMKLLEVGALTSAAIFIISCSLGYLEGPKQVSTIIYNSGWQAVVAMTVAVFLQSLLPLIEKVFHITTSMTLLDYSDANQPLLKRLAMEAPGTYSHSLLLGSIAETAAEAIGRNGLLCRVGAYYHDIGKIAKPVYFTENELGSMSRHRELSPEMSQLIIVGHVKDGLELAREYALPRVLWQFIETHHGTTLVEYFYNEARKKFHDEEIAESEFRYPGPKPQTKEAAIVMLTDCVEGAVRSLGEVNLTRIEAVVHNMAMKRLQDGQFDECDLSLRELSLIESSITKNLAAYHHGRVAYPKAPDMPDESFKIPD